MEIRRVLDACQGKINLLLAQIHTVKEVLFDFEGMLVDSQLFIGDSRNNVGAARRAGMRAGYLRDGEDSPKNMARFPADIELDKLLQLPTILARSESA